MSPIALDPAPDPAVPVATPRTLAEAAFFNAGVLTVLAAATQASAAIRPRSANTADTLDHLAAEGRGMLIRRAPESGCAAKATPPAGPLPDAPASVDQAMEQPIQ